MRIDELSVISSFLHHHRHRGHKPLASVSLSVRLSLSLPAAASRLSGEDDDRFAGVIGCEGQSIFIQAVPLSRSAEVRSALGVAILEEFADFTR